MLHSKIACKRKPKKVKPPTGDQAPRKKHGNPSASLPDKQSIKINNKSKKPNKKKPFYIHTQLVDRGTNNILLMPRLVKIKHQHHPLGLRKKKENSKIKYNRLLEENNQKTIATSS